MKVYGIIEDEILEYLRNADIIKANLYKDLENPRIRYLD